MSILSCCGLFVQKHPLTAKIKKVDKYIRKYHNMISELFIRAAHLKGTIVNVLHLCA